MKNIKNILIPILLLPVLFSACKDNPVTIQEEFAPPRFNWRTVDINQNMNPGFADIWALDTNNIYLLNHYDKSLYIISHNIITTHYAGNYYLTQMKGLSNNEIYIFAAGYASRLLTIIKWNGGGFEYYPTDITVATGVSALTIRSCVVNSNEIWALSIDGICRFDGTNMTNYSFGEPTDSLLVPIDLFLSSNHKMQYIANNADTGNNQNRLYEFRDTGFVKIFEDNIVTHMTLLREVGGVNFGLQLNYNVPLPGTVCIKYFTGSSFTDYFCYNDVISYSFWTGVSKNPVGTNLQCFIFLAQAKDAIFYPIIGQTIPDKVGILHWDGNRVSKEIGVGAYTTYYDFEHHILFAINQDNYLILEPFKNNDPAISLLYIGSKK